MAEMAVHHEDEKDSVFFRFLRITQREATDARNYVIKAVGWALRQIGKRNLRLNEKAINVAKTIAKKDSSSARWIAFKALRELQREKIMTRLRDKSGQ